MTMTYNILSVHVSHVSVVILYKSYPITGLDTPLGLYEFETVRIIRSSAREDGKIVNCTHRPPLPPCDTSGTHFC